MFIDAPVFIPLAGLTDHGLILDAIAAEMDIRAAPPVSLRQSLIAELAQKHILLVLDNLEHLVAGAADISDLLTSCSYLRILATSRTPLGIYGEHQVPVDPLEVPPPDTQFLDALGKYDAVDLFLDRASTLLPSFVPTRDEGRFIVEVCRRLDGLPLGIELAASRFKYLSIEELGSRLAQRFDLLNSNLSSLPERHQTLKACIDWSYLSLSEPEKACFRNLSIFQDGWTLEAASAVLGYEQYQEAQVLEIVSRLIDQSLVVREAHGNRYRLLETLREYGLDRLAEVGELHHVSSRLLDWCLSLAERAEPLVWGPDQVQWLDRLESEVGNIRAALSWAAANIDSTEPPFSTVARALRLVNALERLWVTRSHVSEGRDWLREFLKHPSGKAERSLGLALLSIAEFLLGDVLASDALGEEGARLAREIGDWAALCLCLATQVGAKANQGDFHSAFTLLNEGLEVAGHAGPRRESQMIFVRVQIALALNEPEARNWLDRGMHLSRELGDIYGLSWFTFNLGYLQLLNGDTKGAEGILKEGLQLWSEIRDRQGIGLALEWLAWISAQAGFWTVSVRLLGAAEYLRASFGGTVLPLWQPLRENALSTCKAYMDERKFSMFWKQGVSLSLPNAIHLALSDWSELQEETNDRESNHKLGLLSRRELEVACLVAEGMTNRQIANHLVLSERTVDTHVTNILRKLSLKNRVHLASIISIQPWPSSVISKTARRL
jgi:predicted ATPase/DNA-binding CsgD family transcriptional regulator